MRFNYCLLAALFCTACSSAWDEESAAVAEVKEISVSAPDFLDENSSRTHVEITSKGAVFTWAENDTIGIFPNEGGQVYFPMIQGAGTHSASFSGGGWAMKASSTYSAYYPLVDRASLNQKQIPISYEGQTQVGNASTDHLGRYDFMATRAQTAQNGSINFSFRHLGCLVELHVPIYQTTLLKSVSLIAPDRVFTLKGNIDISREVDQIQATETSSTFTVNLRNVVTTAAEPEAVVYLLMPPVDLKGKTLEVRTTDANNMTYHSHVAGKRMVAGRAYRLMPDKPHVTHTQSPLISGTDFNVALKSLIASSPVGNQQKGFSALFEFETSSNRQPSAHCVSVSGAEHPAYMTFENGRILVYTAADEFVLNRNCSSMFYNLPFVCALDLRNCNSGQVTDMSHLFSGTRFVSLNLSGFATSQTTDMAWMFSDCHVDQTVDLGTDFVVSDGTGLAGFGLSWTAHTVKCNALTQKLLQSVVLPAEGIQHWEIYP